jgi:hypothetical protein
MDFVSIDDFLPDVLPEVVGCTVFAARDAVRLAVIEFCKETGVSAETTEEIDLEANEKVIDLPSPSGDVEPWQVLWMKTDEGPVDPIDRRSMVERRMRWGHLDNKRPDLYTRINRKQVEIMPYPSEDADEVLTIHCSYIPKRDADRIDARIFDEYREAITSGALSKLLKKSNTDWYDPDEARERALFFAIEMSEARVLADKDFQTGPTTVQMSPMA